MPLDAPDFLPSASLTRLAKPHQGPSRYVFHTAAYHRNVPQQHKESKEKGDVNNPPIQSFQALRKQNLAPCTQISRGRKRCSSSGSMRKIARRTGHAVCHVIVDAVCLGNPFPPKKHLSSVCRNITGSSAKALIAAYLVTHIKLALHHTPHSIKELAYQFCFPSSSHFCQFFKQHTGHTPLRYRGEGWKG